MKDKTALLGVDGFTTYMESIPDANTARKLVGADCLDVVMVGKRRNTIMYVDDTGMVDGKPVNPEATKLYHAICRPGTLHQIHGDVLLVNKSGIPDDLLG